MALLSHRLNDPSCSVGTSPVGFMARYSGASVRPKAPPASIRSKGRFNSTRPQSTFITLLDVVRPQTMRFGLSAMVASLLFALFIIGLIKRGSQLLDQSR